MEYRTDKVTGIGSNFYTCKSCNQTILLPYSCLPPGDYTCTACSTTSLITGGVSTDLPLYFTTTEVEVQYQEALDSKKGVIKFKKENDFYYWYFLQKDEFDDEYTRLIHSTQSFEVFIKSFINFMNK